MGRNFKGHSKYYDNKSKSVTLTRYANSRSLVQKSSAAHRKTRNSQLPHTERKVKKKKTLTGPQTPPVFCLSIAAKAPTVMSTWIQAVTHGCMSPGHQRIQNLSDGIRVLKQVNK